MSGYDSTSFTQDGADMFCKNMMRRKLAPVLGSAYSQSEDT
jgi:hypothetical protein